MALIDLLVVLVLNSGAVAQDFSSDRRRFLDTLGAVTGEDIPKGDDGQQAAKQKALQGMQTFIALVSGNPDDLCPPQLIIAVQKHLGVKVEGASEKVAWEITDTVTRSNSSYREEVRISYPGLVGLSLGPWDAVPEPDGRWRCSMALSTSAVQSLQDYLTLARIKSMELEDITALSNAAAVIRGIAERFRVRRQDDLAIEADGLLGTLTQKLLAAQLEKGQVTVNLTCELCSEEGCANVIGQLKGAGVSVSGPRWEEFRDSVLYYSDERVLQLLQPVVRRHEYSHGTGSLQAIKSNMPAAKGVHANLLIRESTSLGDEIRRARGRCHQPTP